MRINSYYSIDKDRYGMITGSLSDEYSIINNQGSLVTSFTYEDDLTTTYDVVLTGVPLRTYFENCRGVAQTGQSDAYSTTMHRGLFNPSDTQIVDIEPSELRATYKNDISNYLGGSNIAFAVLHTGRYPIEIKIGASDFSGTGTIYMRARYLVDDVDGKRKYAYKDVQLTDSINFAELQSDFHSIDERMYNLDEHVSDAILWIKLSQDTMSDTVTGSLRFFTKTSVGRVV